MYRFSRFEGMDKRAARRARRGLSLRRIIG
jgi:hypothetical protein